ncbi:vegetative cell wall protein, partial [Streptomyces pilosus]
ARLLAAETEAKLAEIARQQRQAEAEAELNLQRRAAEQARLDAEAARQTREKEAAHAQARREQEARQRAQRIAAQAATSSVSASASTPKRVTASVSTSGSVSPLGGRGAKKQAEVEAVLARLVEADDPKAYPLSEVMADFGLTQTTAYDRLVTAQRLYAEAQNPKSEKTA